MQDNQMPVDHEARVSAAPARKSKLPYLIKFLLETAPLGLFFVSNVYFGLIEATAILMASAVICLVISYMLTRHIAIVPVVTTCAVVVFGSLTLLFHDETFILIKPTILNMIFSAVMLGSVIFKRPILPIVFEGAFHLEALGWEILTKRFGLFFLGLAILNEIVWRTQSHDMWVNFKVFGIMPLTFVFFVLQMPLILRYEKSAVPERKTD